MEEEGKDEETSYESLLSEALQNAKDDRSRAVEAFEKTKDIYDVDTKDPETMRGLMLLGQNIPKLLELASKSNEQIIKLAQLREKENPKKSNDDRFDIDLIREEFEGREKKVH